MIEAWAVGGYSLIGKNMTAVKIDDEVIILDIGFNVSKLVEYDSKDGEEISKMSYEKLLKLDAIPDDREMSKEWSKKVKAIVVGHAHIDHCGAVRVIAPRYKDAPVIGTPFTIEVIKNTLEGKKLPNRLLPLNPSSKYKISENITVEMVNITHSTPQTAMVVLHTPYGKIVYANDFKLDNNPLIGRRPDYEKYKKIGEDCIMLISDTTRVEKSGHTPSESIAREMLRDVMMRYKDRDVGMIVTTFSSHIARLASIIAHANSMNRKPILLGRSLSNYIAAAKRATVFSTDAKVVGFRRQIDKSLRDANKNKGKYVIICTGNQGEPNAALSRIVNNESPYKLNEDDVVIFSSEVIPTPVCIANRYTIEEKMINANIRVFKDAHVSGHASREDQKEFLQLLKPRHYIPTHGGIEKLAAAAAIAKSIGYILNQNVHILQDGQRLVVE